MKTVIVTGATTGIGRYIAGHLHQKGYRVFGTSRTPEKYGKEIPFELVRLDISSDRSIGQCIEAVYAAAGSVDALVNNAGMGICGSAEETTLEQAYRQFETNFWGTVKMTRAVLPRMRQHHSGNIITIGSLAGLIGVPFQSYYSASKHALEGFFKALRLEAAPFGIRISLVEPGFFKTNLHHVFEYAPPVLSDYNVSRKGALDMLNRSIEKAHTPEPVAKVVLKILQAENPSFSYRVGKNTKLAPVLQFLNYNLYEFGMKKTFRLNHA